MERIGKRSTGLYRSLWEEGGINCHISPAPVLVFETEGFVLLHQLKMKRISSREAIPYFSVPSEINVVQTYAGDPGVSLSCFSSTVKRSDPSTGTPGLSNKTCLACVIYGFILPPNK